MITKDFDLDDVFLMSEIVDKMDLQLDIESALNLKAIEGADEEELGKQFFMKILPDLGMKFIKKLHKARKEVKRFIASMTDMSVTEVGKMRPKQLKEFFVELIEREGFKDFLAESGVLEENK